MTRNRPGRAERIAMSDGATTVNPAPKENPGKRLARLNRERREQEQAEMARLRAENERLKGGSAAQTVAPVPPAATGYDPTIDPLSVFIGADEVHLVGKMFALPGNIQQKPVKTMPGDTVEFLQHESVGTWGYCPFKFVGRTQEETNNLKLMNEQHHFLILTRHYADRVAESKFGKIPKTAPITPADFTGNDRRGQPLGHKRPTSGDNLVELLRWYLQRYAGSLWVNRMGHLDAMPMEGPFSHRHPNPYGRAFERNHEPDPMTVKRATPEGDVLPGVVKNDPGSWGEKPKGA
jgi:hypothetical protein